MGHYAKNKRLSQYLGAQRNIGQHYEIGQIFYKGSHFDIRYATNRQTNERVAVKVYQWAKLYKEELEDVMKEAEILMNSDS